MLSLCGGLILLSVAGALTTVEGIVAAPLQGLSGLFNRLSLSISSTLEELNDLGQLRERIAELEEQLARRQIESIQLREAASDYERLIDLLSYTSALENQEFLTADVIAVEQTGIARSVIINRGTRDGIAVGMPVTTNLGLVGRIIRGQRQRRASSADQRRKQRGQLTPADIARAGQHHRPGLRCAAPDDG